MRRKTASPLYPGSALHLDTRIFLDAFVIGDQPEGKAQDLSTSYIIRMTTPQSVERGQSSPDG
jgi:hypothetical protein